MDKVNETPASIQQKWNIPTNLDLCSTAGQYVVNAVKESLSGSACERARRTVLYVTTEEVTETDLLGNICAVKHFWLRKLWEVEFVTFLQ